MTRLGDIASQNRPFSSVTSTSFVSLLSTWLLPSHWLATALLW